MIDKQAERECGIYDYYNNEKGLLYAATNCDEFLYMQMWNSIKLQLLLFTTLI